MDLELELHQEVIRDQYKASLYLTAKDLLGYAEVTKYTHLPMIQALQAPTSRKLLVVPRGCFKSSLGVIAFSIWRLLKDPNERILIDSEVYTNSKNFMREIKGHFESPKFVQLFGNWHSNNWTEGELTIKPRTKAYKEASITCSGIGAVKVGQHYSTIIMDDMNSDNNSQTVEGRQKVINHYRMNTAILEPDGVMVVIGTRYATDDVIGYILDKEIAGKGML
jgi:hypothetical protein